MLWQRDWVQFSRNSEVQAQWIVWDYPSRSFHTHPAALPTVSDDLNLQCISHALDLGVRDPSDEARTRLGCKISNAQAATELLSQPSQFCGILFRLSSFSIASTLPCFLTTFLPPHFLILSQPSLRLFYALFLTLEPSFSIPFLQSYLLPFLRFYPFGLLIFIYVPFCMYVCRFQKVVLRCPTPRLHCFLSSHWPSFSFLSFMAFLVLSIQFFFGLPRAVFCFGIHFNAILGNLPSAILWTSSFLLLYSCRCAKPLSR